MPARTLLLAAVAVAVAAVVAAVRNVAPFLHGSLLLPAITRFDRSAFRSSNASPAPRDGRGDFNYSHAT